MTGTESQGWSYVSASLPTDRMVSAPGNGVREGNRLPRKTRAPHPVWRPGRARHSRCGNQRLESRVRENRTHGSEGGEAKAFPTPILSGAERVTSRLQVEVLTRVSARIGVGKAFASPPSEPCVRFSRTRLSSRWFPHRGCLALSRPPYRVRSPGFARKAVAFLDTVARRRHHPVRRERGFHV